MLPVFYRRNALYLRALSRMVAIRRSVHTLGSRKVRHPVPFTQHPFCISKRCPAQINSHTASMLRLRFRCRERQYHVKRMFHSDYDHVMSKHGHEASCHGMSIAKRATNKSNSLAVPTTALFSALKGRSSHYIAAYDDSGVFRVQLG